MRRIALFAILFLICLPLFGQTIQERVNICEGLMERGRYSSAKYELMLAIGDLGEEGLYCLQNTSPALSERLANDLTEARILSGDIVSVLADFQKQTTFKSYKEGLRHFHLECLWCRQNTVKRVFGKDITIAREAHQAETAYALFQQNRQYVEDASSMERLLLEDLLLAYWDSDNQYKIQETLDKMRPLVSSIPYGSRDWPAWYWWFTADRMHDNRQDAQAEGILKKVLAHFLEHDFSQAYVPFATLADIYNRRGDKTAIHDLTASTARAIKKGTLSMLRWMTLEDRYAIGRDYTTLRAYSALTVLPEGTYEDVFYDAALFSKTVINDIYVETADNVRRMNDDALNREYTSMLLQQGSASSWYQNYIFLKAYEKGMPQLSDMEYSWKEVQKQLGDNEVAVEFLRTGNGFSQYSAAIIRKGWRSPKVVTLCKESDLAVLGMNAGAYRGENARMGYLRLLSPLAQFIRPGDHVYYSPEGTVSLLNLDAFLTPDGKRVGDVYSFHRVLSTKRLGKGCPPSRYDNLFLFGGMDYKAPVADIAKEAAPFHAITPLWVLEMGDGFDGRLDFGRTETGTRAGFDNLAYSYQEVENVSAYWKGKVNTVPITGKRAIEERFKYLAMSAHPEEKNIFHIATHSFTREPEYSFGLSREELAFKADGLLFSGAGHSINKERLPEGLNDGLLFGEEVARLDLRSADLVVLSACNTAKGDDTLDGILGIQRAFKRAGAGTIIMTLWKVNDKATMRFMDLFYGRLSEGASKYDAFKEAQATMSVEYEDPYYWAPFIMLD